jgi:hypothetical protein
MAHSPKRFGRGRRKYLMDTTPTILETGRPSDVHVSKIVEKKVGSLLLRQSFLICFLSGAFMSSFWVTPIEASSHHVRVLEIPASEGSIPTTLTFPLYEQEGIQYFSAGLGKEERRLNYPPFSLKLIFVQGERAYLAGVSIHLVSEDGMRRFKIPGEEVEGPWLFINVPTGTYLVSGADSNGTTIEKTITIQNDKLTVVHFRFP